MTTEHRASDALDVHVPLGVFGDLVPAVEVAEAATRSRVLSSGLARSDSGVVEPNVESDSFPPSPRPSIMFRPSLSQPSSTANPTNTNAPRPSTVSLLERVRRASNAARPDTFMTVIQSAKLMNAPTTEETAISKAAFYDRMLQTLDDGLEEGVALAQAVKAAKEAGGAVVVQKSGGVSQDSAKSREATSLGAKDKVGATHEDLAGAGNETPPSSRPSTPSPSVPSSNPSTRGRTKLQGLFDKMIKPTVQKHDAHLTGGSGVSMAHLRVLHRRVMMTVEEYDEKTFGDALDREKRILKSSQAAIDKARDEIRAALIAEYEPRIKHDTCNARIFVLTRENNIMKEETTRTMQINQELTTEVANLRLYKSTAEAEQELMVDELARRRLHTRAMRQNLVRAVKRIEELEKELGYGGNGTEDVKQRFLYSEAEDGGEDDERIVNEEWEQWCRTAKFTRPDWNASTASKLLSQPTPPSVIHIGDCPDLPAAQERDAVCDKDERPSTVDKMEFVRRVHAPCREKRHVLRNLVRKEKEERRRLITEANRNKSLICQLTDLLAECLGDVRDHPAQTTPENLSIAARDGTILRNRLSSHQSRLRNLLSSLTTTASHQPVTSDEEDAYSEDDSPSSTHSPPRTRSQTPHQHRAPTPLGYGAGVPSSEIHLRPSDFHRPHIPIDEITAKATKAAKAAKLLSVDQDDSSVVEDKATAIPSPSAGLNAARFVDVGKWVTRINSRPSSAPISRHGVPGTTLYIGDGGEDDLEADRSDYATQRQGVMEPAEGAGTMKRRESKTTIPATSVNISHKRIRPKSAHISSATTQPAKSRGDLRQRSQRPVSAPVGARTGGMAGIVINRDRSANTNERAKLKGMLVSGKHIG